MKVFDVTHNMSTIKSHIKVRVDAKVLETAVSTVMSGFSMINALGRDDTMVMGVNVGEIYILNGFKALLIPEFVNIDGTSRCFTDLIDHKAFAVKNSVTYSEFADAMDAISTWCKSAKKDRTKLTDVRGGKSLSSAIASVTINNMVHYSGEDKDMGCVIPLTIDPGVASYYCNMTEEDYSRELWRHILINM